MTKIIKEIKTKNGNIIQLIEKKPTAFEAVVLFVGVIHGDEPQGKFLIERYLKEKQALTISKNRFLFIPCLNPDGLKAGQRVNANGVDINRNFCTKNWALTKKNEFYGGKKAGSETETKFLTDIIDEEKPNVVVTFHAPFKIVNYDGEAKNIAHELAKITGYPLQADIGYPTPGSLGTFCGIERNIPTITFEVDETLSDNQQWERCSGVFEFFENSLKFN